jgi:hypothetical protein
MAKKARKAYQELRDGIEALVGGKMWYEQAGRPKGGAWIVRLGNKEKIIEWDNHRFPQLDERYELRDGVSEPQSHSDYATTLRPGAIEELVQIIDASGQ